MLKAIVFDFDGVLVDSEPLHWRATARVMAPFGYELTYAHYLDAMIGFDDRDLLRACLDEARDQTLVRARPITPIPDPSDPDALRRLIDAKAQAFEDVVAQGLEPIPGAPAFVRQAAAALPTAIASGATRRDIDLCLRGLGLAGCVGAIVSADMVAKSKPDPETYVKAVAALAKANPAGRIMPGECLAIEDTAAGLASAKAAGLRTLALATNHSDAMIQQADRRARDFTELSLAELQAWFAKL